MRIALLTREYPPDIYGGAGVHVEYLAAELARLVEVDVHCFGAREPAGAREPGRPLILAIRHHLTWTRPTPRLVRWASISGWPPR